MKSNLLLFILPFIFIVSCTETEGVKPAPPTLDSTFTSYDSSYSVRMQIRRQGHNENADYVYKITYDSANLIRRILDSTNGTVWAAAYNENGNLSKIIKLLSDSTRYTYTYTYNGNQLIQIDNNSYIEGVLQRRTITYNNGLPAKSTYSSSNDGGLTYGISGDWVYTVANGNITYRLLANLANNTVYYGITCIYNNDENILKQFALFPEDDFSLFDPVSLESYLSKNLIISSNNSGAVIRYNYSYNDKKQLIKFTASQTVGTMDSVFRSVTFTY